MVKPFLLKMSSIYLPLSAALQALHVGNIIGEKRTFSDYMIESIIISCCNCRQGKGKLYNQLSEKC